MTLVQSHYSFDPVARDSENSFRPYRASHLRENVKKRRALPSCSTSSSANSNSREELPLPSGKYKTELCKHWLEKKTCFYG